MGRFVLIAAAVALVAAGIYFGNYAFQSTVSQRVDRSVAELVEEENQSLPKRVAESTILERIEHKEAAKEIVFHYRFQVDVPADQRQRVESTAHRRTRNNSKLTRALKHGVTIKHRFTDPAGRVRWEFETSLE